MVGVRMCVAGDAEKGRDVGMGYSFRLLFQLPLLTFYSLSNNFSSPKRYQLSPCHYNTRPISLLSNQLLCHLQPLNLDHYYQHTLQTSIYSTGSRGIVSLVS